MAIVRMVSILIPPRTLTDVQVNIQAIFPVLDLDVDTVSELIVGALIDALDKKRESIISDDEYEASFGISMVSGIKQGG